MSKLRFVKPEVVRLPLSSEDWIEIKKELSIGEQRRFQTASFTDYRQKNATEEGKFGVDMSALAFARMETYIKDWSFRDAQDKPVKVSRQAIEALAPEDFEEIDKAIDAHVTALAEEKKAMTGAATSSPA